MSSKSRKPLKPLGAPGLIAVVVATLFLGLLGGLAAAFLTEQPGRMGVILTAVTLSVVMAGALGVAAWWWRRVDEAAKEAHKWAWYWGGSCGMLVGGVGLLTLSIRGGDIALPASLGETPAELLALGMMAIMMCQTVGYLIAWAGWWWSRR